MTSFVQVRVENESRLVNKCNKSVTYCMICNSDLNVKDYEISISGHFLQIDFADIL